MEDDKVNSLIEDQDRFAKYRRRNEIEAMALLRGKRIDDLYNPL